MRRGFFNTGLKVATAASLLVACGGDKIKSPQVSTPDSNVPSDGVEGGADETSGQLVVGFKVVEMVNCKKVLADTTGDAQQQLAKLEAAPTLDMTGDIASMFDDSKQYIGGMLLAGCRLFVEENPVLGRIDSSVPMSLACVALLDDPKRCSLLDPRSAQPVFDN